MDKQKRKIEEETLEDGRKVMRYEGDLNWVVVEEDE